MYLVTLYVSCENQDASKCFYIYLDYRLHGSVFYYWRYIIRCTLQVLHSRILPREVLAV